MKPSLQRLSIGTLAIGALGVGLVYSDPVIKITPINASQLQVGITNGSAAINYELYRRVSLDPIDPWTYEAAGIQGQTNFVVDIGIETTGFFQVREGLDWDLDGIPNVRDGQPSNATIGALRVVIDSPLQGENLTN